MLILSVSPSPQGQKLNASFAQGETIGINFIATINGAPINLTGTIIKLTIGFPEPETFNNLNGGITITNPLAGNFILNLTSDETADFAPGIYPYDLWIETSTSPPIETQYITGNISVIESVTAVP